MKLRGFVLLLLSLISGMAFAAGPRWVAGSQWTNDSTPMGWYRSDVHYFVDQGALSPSVDNATATALVDAAAAVWNVQGVPFTLTNGGTLAEDVNSGNVYLGSGGVVWPADVSSGNYTAKQIAVVFDADGSITDTLLGSGASAPANCRQNAVTESVDLFIQPGKIAHALLILNGRCTGPAPEQQMQLRYQLMRMFGRVIGLGWSQTNDNVFTGTPAPTYDQQQRWPIMHPIDIVCGLYTYQCMPNPFTLRDDDVASLHMVYNNALWDQVYGAIVLSGWVRFPNGMGMNGVNVVVQRGYPWDNFGTEAFEEVSGVSGVLAQGDFGNPVTGPSTTTTGGGTVGYGPGYFMIRGIPPLTQFPYTTVNVTTQAINPLYSGAYAVGPYRTGTVAPSGKPTGGQQPLSGGAVFQMPNMVPSGASEICSSFADGIESAPVALPQGGAWSARLCGVQHTLWNSFAVHAGRTATIEATATDETGSATSSKALPVIGLWNATDPTGTLPTMASAASALNATHAGMTQLHAAFTADAGVRMAIADQRGDGRPDYTLNVRVLYADSVSPSRMGPSGGAVRILGLGFVPGVTVTIGGVLATVSNVSATEIDAVAPASSALGSVTLADVTVTDPRTGANTTISGGINYAGASNDVLTVVAAPSGNVGVGAAAVFSVRLTGGNGAPVASAAVNLSVPAGSATYGACGQASCTLTTDSSGMVQTTVTALAAGSTTLRTSTPGGASAQVTYNVTGAAQTISLLRPVQYVASGPGAVFHPSAAVAGTAASGVSWSTSTSHIALGAPQVSGSMNTATATGALADNESATVQACVPGNVCATGSVNGVPAANLRTVIASGDGQTMQAAGTLGTVQFRVTDTASHPVAGASVSIHQSVTGWQPVCSGQGRCATPPVYGTSTATAMSDDDGLVSVTPLQYANTAAVTAITVSTGTSGVVTATLQKTP